MRRSPRGTSISICALLLPGSAKNASSRPLDILSRPACCLAARTEMEGDNAATAAPPAARNWRRCMRSLWFDVLGGSIQEEIAVEQADAAEWPCKSTRGLTRLAAP